MNVAEGDHSALHKSLFLAVFDIDPAKLFLIDMLLRTSRDHRSGVEP
jgi:hypothetical protein